MSKMRIGVICGGPSLERGISLNSARSVMDHLVDMDITIFYVTLELTVYVLKAQHIYSNTPEDFDFKLNNIATSVSESEWVSMMKKMDIMLPLIHGSYGEDGCLQTFLEKHSIPYIGSNAQSCANMFFKDKAANYLTEAGYPTLPICQAESPLWRSWLKDGKVVIKPQAGGSSIGVSVVDNIASAEKAVATLKPEVAICEPFCDGIEFTVIVLASGKGPCALIPTEISINTEGAIYDYRRKYLPTGNTHWHCPPRFSDTLIDEIRQQAEEVFELFDMNDFIRMDGWIKDGQVIFSDFNPISGMEQNSFLFLQASRLGMTHQDILNYIIKQSCQRQGIPFTVDCQVKDYRIDIPILMGGDSEERQVSLMSGTNVWLKLRQSKKYNPRPYFVDTFRQVWPLPYTYALNHTVEEIQNSLVNSYTNHQRIKCYLANIRNHLGLDNVAIDLVCPILKSRTLEEFIAGLSDDYVFLALHGGFGENGQLQALLSNANIAYNGACSDVSQLGMDKYKFSKVVNTLRHTRVRALEKILISETTVWEDIQSLGDAVIVKPRDQGCSVGVTVISDEQAFSALCLNQMDYIAEAYIQTDDICIDGAILHHNKITGWVEFTAVVYEEGGVYQSLCPSITVAKNQVLSIEEKFQGGTGINITPPALLAIEDQLFIQSSLANLAKALSVRNYARIDLFFNYVTREIIIIEMNTLPALTPSTVLYHQMLASGYARSPLAGIERLISASITIKENH